MKVFLLHRDRDLDIKPELRDAIFDAMHSANLFAINSVRRRAERPGKAQPLETLSGRDTALVQDLELETLWTAMAAGDQFLFETSKRVLLSSLGDPAAITYRQHVLADCLDHPDIVRQISRLAIEGLESARQSGGLWSRVRPDSILSHSVAVLTRHVEVLRRLRHVAEEDGPAFRSEGFTRFFTMLRDELADDYLATVEHHLRELQLKRGVLESARLGKGNKGVDYLFHRPRERRWRDRMPGGSRPPSHSFEIHPRDEAGFRALEEIRAHGINLGANSVAQSADHVESFFIMLRLELAFYLGCLNLHERLEAKGEAVCIPHPDAAEARTLGARGLYDVCLALRLDDRVVGNDVDADGKSLIMITGANQGGKSTLLRGIGLAQLMMQSGMFVGAQSFRGAVTAGVFTHYKREEDRTMRGGKLDEELRRMSDIADAIGPHSLLLCNESFASTNEREGSEIARQVVRAMLDRRIRVAFVTHMYDLAHGFHEQGRDDALFLRAERGADGRRTFKLREGAPLPTSYGEDSYRRVFGLEAGRLTPTGLTGPRGPTQLPL
jgi:hypothetical protein